MVVFVVHLLRWAYFIYFYLLSKASFVRCLFSFRKREWEHLIAVASRYTSIFWALQRHGRMLGRRAKFPHVQNSRICYSWQLEFFRHQQSWHAAEGRLADSVICWFIVGRCLYISSCLIWLNFSMQDFIAFCFHCWRPVAPLSPHCTSQNGRKWAFDYLRVVERSLPTTL